MRGVGDRLAVHRDLMVRDDGWTAHDGGAFGLARVEAEEVADGRRLRAAASAAGGALRGACRLAAGGGLRERAGRQPENQARKQQESGMNSHREILYQPVTFRRRLHLYLSHAPF